VEQAELLGFTLGILERYDIPYMIVGSLASGAYGEPRLTQDIDIVVEPTPPQLEQLCGAFPPDDFYVSRDAARAALRDGGQFNVLDPSSGNKIDFMIARSDAWGLQQMARRRRMKLFPNREGFTGGPEDIILSKMLYYLEGGSEKHLRDITGMLKISPDRIDQAYVTKWADQLGVTEIWRAVLKRISNV
jgi:hypothetical protein